MSDSLGGEEDIARTSPYSSDLCERFAEHIFAGGSASSGAKRFCISRTTSIVWARRVRSQSNAQALPTGGKRHGKLDAVSVHLSAIFGFFV